MARVHSIYQAMAIVAAAQRKGKPRKRITIETKYGPVTLLNPRYDAAKPMYLAGDMMVSAKPRYVVRLGA